MRQEAGQREGLRYTGDRDKDDAAASLRVMRGQRPVDGTSKVMPDPDGRAGAEMTMELNHVVNKRACRVKASPAGRKLCQRKIPLDRTISHLFTLGL